MDEWAIMLAVSVTMMTFSYLHLPWWPIEATETLGFVTGGICVWLNVREDIWNWPIGIANNVFFFILLLQRGLFADMWLQVIYFGFGLYGWYQWLRGGREHRRLTISRTRLWEWLALTGLVVAGTLGMRELLLYFNGAAPFWDAFTTALSLAAQYLICRKRLENWFVWIVADIIYVPLYLSRHLPLFALLYAVFIVMCVLGLRAWRQTLREQTEVV